MSRKASIRITETVARRRLLLAIAAGAASQSRHVLPDQWARPVIESVVLPAHAQTTDATPLPVDQCPSTPVASTPATISSRTEDEPPEDLDSADINFDGCDNLTLVVTDSDENIIGPDIDIVLSLDVDPWFGDDTSDEFQTFDATHIGGPRWDVLSHNFGGSSDLPPGDYSMTIERTGGGNEGRQFEVALTVTVSTVNDTHQQIVLSNVTATPL